jgi:NAD(P)-dependent dehydrogenase (short-subunit alcohol dehydrogenase family)
MNTVLQKFKLNNKVAIITGGAGLLGVKHAEAIAEAGGIPVLWDIHSQAVQDKSREIAERYSVSCIGMVVDITDPENIKTGVNEVLKNLHRIDILINNAANDPKVAPDQSSAWSRIENFSLDMWQKDITVGLTGAFLCSSEIGLYMAKHGGGVILNIASDLGVIAPDQRIYRKEGIDENEQPVKPVTYSVVKHGLIGLTKYLATYWAENKVRVNAISPGGVYTDQPEDFVGKLTTLIPMGRMAQRDEYKAAVLFLVSDGSSYMTGTNLIIDGGRTCW